MHPNIPILIDRAVDRSDSRFDSDAQMNLYACRSLILRRLVSHLGSLSHARSRQLMTWCA